MTKNTDLPILRIAGVWGQVEPVEGSVYLKLEKNEDEHEPQCLATVILVNHAGEKIRSGNVVAFVLDTTLNNMVYVSPIKGINPQAYICRNNKTNGICIYE